MPLTGPHCDECVYIRTLNQDTTNQNTTQDTNQDTNLIRILTRILIGILIGIPNQDTNRTFFLLHKKHHRSDLLLVVPEMPVAIAHTFTFFHFQEVVSNFQISLNVFSLLLIPPVTKSWG